jgi:hypothetical protein
VVVCGCCDGGVSFSVWFEKCERFCDDRVNVIVILLVYGGAFDFACNLQHLFNFDL